MATTMQRRRLRCPPRLPCGTQDFIWLNGFYQWKPGEREAFVQTIARLSERPVRRVSYVVSSRYRWSGPFGWSGETGTYSVYFGPTRCANHNDWLICRAAMQVLSEITVREQSR
jgi:hypothetical protein